MTDINVGILDGYANECAIRCCRQNSDLRSKLLAIDAKRASQQQRDSTAPRTSPRVQEVSLDLSHNIIGSKGLASLVSTIVRGPMLQVCVVSLVLRGNFLSNNDVMILCDGIESASTNCATYSGRPLTHLDLSDNPISQPAGKRLQLLLTRVKGLETLLLHQTLINQGLQKRIQRILDLRAQRKATGPRPCLFEDTVGKGATSSRHDDPTATDSPGFVRQESIDVPLVAPRTAFVSLSMLYQTCFHDAPSDLNNMMTSHHQPIALLMAASRLKETLRGETECTEATSTTGVGAVQSMDGATFLPRAMVDVHTSALPGSIGSTITTTGSTRLASPFEHLHVLLALPTGAYTAVELMLRSAIRHDFSSGVPQLRALSTLRATTAMELRLKDRCALNLLLSSAFNDPRPPRFDPLVAPLSNVTPPTSPTTLTEAAPSSPPFAPPPQQHRGSLMSPTKPPAGPSSRRAEARMARFGSSNSITSNRHAIEAGGSVDGSVEAMTLPTVLQRTGSHRGSNPITDGMRTGSTELMSSNEGSFNSGPGPTKEELLAKVLRPTSLQALLDIMDLCDEEATTSGEDGHSSASSGMDHLRAVMDSTSSQQMRSSTLPGVQVK